MRRPEVLTPGAGAIVKQGMDTMEMSVSADVQSQALAAQAEAEVKARWFLAQKNPRDWDVVREKLLRECRRPSFAESATYEKPVGNDTVRGPSIRFVEAALRCMGNVYCPTTIISEDMHTRRIQVMVTDLESNVSWPRVITISKTVERRDSRGREVVSQRTNSYGKPVFVVLATDDELANKEAAAISKAIRMAGLRVLPGDLVEEAQAVCDETSSKEDAKDPGAVLKRMLDAFAGVGVPAASLKEYVGKPFDQLNPSELKELRRLHAAIKDGETKWADVLELKRGPAEKPSAPAAPSAPPKSGPKGATDPTESLPLQHLKEALERAPDIAALPVPPHDPVTGEVKETPALDPNGPEAACEALCCAFDVAPTLAELMKLNSKVKDLPQDLQEKAMFRYEARKAELRAAAAKKGG